MAATAAWPAPRGGPSRMMPGGFESRHAPGSVRDAMQPRTVRPEQAPRSCRAQAPTGGGPAPLEDLPDELADGLSPSKKKKKKAAEKKRTKTQMPEFPEEVMDETGAFWKSGRVLGQGGFARVYDMSDAHGARRAFKGISKLALIESKKNKAKLLAEIMIHRSLDHPNIVRFEEAFEDDNNVYFRLELCKNGSMNDILKRRGAYTEPETRFFMIQILAGVQYMHINSVIHRDLKLGNIFLDEGMNVKIGDFGLAALLKYRGERKKTMCGTPNYIAPEIIEDPHSEGHSFEVDVWSVGVILYTLLVGKPPFQTNDVNGIYDNIRTSNYQIPSDARISQEACDLITLILARNPADRPSLIQIMNHPWFQVGAVPIGVPQSTAMGIPSDIILPRTVAESRQNFERLKAAARFRDDADDPVDEDADMVDENGQASVRRTAREERREQERVEEERDKLNRRINQAVQPGSPIASLLKAGRQPLVRVGGAGASANAAVRTGVSSLAKQLSQLNVKAQHGHGTAAPNGDKISASTRARTVDKENAGPGSGMPPPQLPRSRQGHDGEALDVDERRLLGQKARLVASMTAAAGSAVSAASAESANRRARAGDIDRAYEQHLQAVQQPGKKLSSYEATVKNLGDALRCLDDDLPFEAVDSAGDPIEVSLYEDHADPQGLKRPILRHAFVLCWLDNMDRFGLGYGLSDGSLGAYFRDGSSMVYNNNRTYCDFNYPVRTRPTSSASNAADEGRAGPRELRRESLPLPEQPARDTTQSDSVRTRWRIMAHFESEIHERLLGMDHPLLHPDVEAESGMPFVHKWDRATNAVVFRLSNGIIQFNFFDHIKVFLSNEGSVVSAIDVVRADGGPSMRSWLLSDLIAIAHNDRSAREAEDEERVQNEGAEPTLARTKPADRRFARTLIRKLKYMHGILAPKAAPSARTIKPPVAGTQSAGVAGASAASGAIRTNALTRTASTASVASSATSSHITGA
ncbi:Pkinase-domain-containing protein [Ceraceosorus guamensis]|uniref:Pkinase-domain-containing protein n=1 Tax=Ceraceosorus guamensis TaxID=1522189 RepID=A0A316VWD0_9BASI|nr:Pkinase-domain-containing protein [Ceraceosorus guamensis]PWN41749.1 Pkinase-domain-containing protein [Ceraceosorus guamensis]